MKNSLCINCKDIVYSNGIAKDSLTCFCQSPFSWWSHFQVCGCFSDYSQGNSCSGKCSALADATLKSQCIACNGSTFAYSIIGCLNCTAIPFGTGATPSTYFGVCTCAVGYKFSYSLAACICMQTGYYLSGTSCLACSALSTTLQSACNSCLAPTFIKNGYIC